MKENYYSELAHYYKYLHTDWDASVIRQSKQLDSIIRELGPGAGTLLDVSCGIGTQCLGLAALGYQVSASDICKEELDIARQEAAQRGLRIDFRTADMRSVSSTFKTTFDVVLSADNAIPHLQTDAEIAQAFREFHRLLNHGGLCVVTVRDYAGLNPENKKTILFPRQTHSLPGGKLVLFDLWEFDGAYYDMTTYIVKDTGGNHPETLVARGRYYRVAIARLEQLLADAGFDHIRTFSDRFYQPVLSGRKT